MKLYTLERPDFYDAQASSLNPLRRWFHKSRHDRVRKLVERYASQDSLIADIGCGNVVWNYDNKFNVIGIDVNPEALDYVKSQGRIIQSVVSPAEKIDLSDRTVDVAVCSEVIEHIPGFWKVMQEAYRILQPGGVFITTVPYDTVLSFWRPLFWAQCMYQGYVKQDEYYKQKCGHVNNFSPRTIRQYLESCGFDTIHQDHMKWFTIFTVGRKS